MGADDPHATIVTPVPSVETFHMDPENVMPDTIFPVVTKLKPDAWEIALRNAGILNKFNNILVGLRQGFYCGLENFLLSCTSVPCNHYVLQEDEEFVITKYDKEIELGRLSHGYEPDTPFSLIGHFCTAPLAVIDQGGHKHCVIVNHSYPKNKHCIDSKNLPHDASKKYIINPTETSINMIIDSKKFQCAWGSFLECYLLVADVPEGTQAAVFNVNSAFKNIPTHPSACWFLAIMIKGLIHLDHVLNFSASPASAIFGRVTDAMVRILMSPGIEAIVKWVDDFIFLHYPSCQLVDSSYKYTYSSKLIWSISEELGWPWAPVKFVDFSTTFMYIGFWWDLSAKQVELPEKKVKYLECISDWTHGSLHTAKEAEKIIGTLNHVCLVMPDGHSQMVSLYKF